MTNNRITLADKYYDADCTERTAQAYLRDAINRKHDEAVQLLSKGFSDMGETEIRDFVRSLPYKLTIQLADAMLTNFTTEGA